jgi:hypothetical protein
LRYRAGKLRLNKPDGIHPDGYRALVDHRRPYLQSLIKQ